MTSQALPQGKRCLGLATSIRSPKGGRWRHRATGSMTVTVPSVCCRPAIPRGRASRHGFRRAPQGAVGFPHGADHPGQWTGSVRPNRQSSRAPQPLGHDPSKGCAERRVRSRRRRAGLGLHHGKGLIEAGGCSRRGKAAVSPATKPVPASSSGTRSRRAGSGAGRPGRSAVSKLAALRCNAPHPILRPHFGDPELCPWAELSSDARQVRPSSPKIGRGPTSTSRQKRRGRAAAARGGRWNGAHQRQSFGRRRPGPPLRQRPKARTRSPRGALRAGSVCPGTCPLSMRRGPSVRRDRAVFRCHGPQSPTKPTGILPGVPARNAAQAAARPPGPSARGRRPQAVAVRRPVPALEPWRQSGNPLASRKVNPASGRECWRRTLLQE